MITVIQNVKIWEWKQKIWWKVSDTQWFTFCKKRLKAEETYYNMKVLTGSPYKARTDNLPPTLVYF